MKNHKTSFLWIKFIKEVRFLNLVLMLLGAYLLINLLFTITYNSFGILKCGSTFLDYFYFSCVTSFTVGYGDLFPITDIGKILVIFHICISSISFAIYISILTTKVFYPRETIVFSDKIVINRSIGYICIRLLNTHSVPLINPEFRVFYTEHCIGNVIAKTESFHSFNELPFLGIHDFTLGVSVNLNFISNLDSAIIQDQKNKEPKSRFRVVISVTGNNGIQQIAQMKRYYSKDLVDGINFKAIAYNEEDQKKWRRIDYSKFGNFWSDFNTIF